jgi:Tol biopolymer transport system component
MATRSEVMIHDLATGQDRLVLATDMLIEAPNWLPDGSALIVNGEGRLYHIPLADPALEQIDTGFATRLNNDHGISPDGQTLVISNHTIPGQSCIYTLPVTGGTPRRVTENTPSWWHGWSPDGQHLAYTAVRDRAFGIWTIPLSGGAETCIAGGGGHHDGPDYTPDGRWVWFNSDQGGAGMQLWRVRPDGTGRERMTGDAFVNWFPHPSPDGAHVLYLAYPPGTEGHPRDLHVELRLMPASGGGSRRLVAVFGGQGSINVPCWAPDARRFAYMRYVPQSA